MRNLPSINFEKSETTIIINCFDFISVFGMILTCAQFLRFTLTQAMGLYSHRDGRNDNLDTLPTAATCMNRLTLPPYSSQESMKKHLLIAIRYGSKGFVFA